MSRARFWWSVGGWGLAGVFALAIVGLVVAHHRRQDALREAFVVVLAEQRRELDALYRRLGLDPPAELARR